MTDTAALIDERAKTHGAFRDHAYCTQGMKDVLHECLSLRTERNQVSLTSQQQESIEMILHKIGRIVAGDASHPDHWNDIAGYAAIANKVFP